MISKEIVLDIDADFDTKLYEDFALELLYIFFGCVGMDWGALALGDAELSLEILLSPPPPQNKKSSEKCYGGLVSPDLLGKSVGNFLMILDDCVKGFALD